VRPWSPHSPRLRRGRKSAHTAARRVPAATSDAGRRRRRSTRRVAEHLEGWLENRSVVEQPVSAHVERELRSYLTCGILCFGFGRARCASCGQGFVVAFSCKGRGVCPSCNGRRMAQTAAHLVDRVIPPVPVRQWVVSVPKRLRGFLADRPQAVADMRHAEMPPPTAATHATNRPPTTPPGLRGRNSWRGWGRSFRWSARGVVATSGSSRSSPIRGRSGRYWRPCCFIQSGEPLEPPPVSPARGPPTDWGELVQVHDDRAIFQGRIDELPDIDIHSL
jgi:hypothetical protein